MASELKRLIEQVSREKGIDRQTLIQTLEEAIKSAIRKKFGSKLDLDVTFNEEYGEIEAFQFKEVVEEVSDPDKQVVLSEALKLDSESEIGDELGIRMDTETLGRIAAQSAKQVIIQKMKDAEREVVYDEFKSRKGEIVNGIVQRVDKGAILVNVGQAEAILPQKEQIPREVFRQGDRIRSYVLDVKKISKGPQIVLSRTHPHFLIQLFHSEVPEISEGIVSIISAAREPGSRAKIAVISKDSDVDPVGRLRGDEGDQGPERGPGTARGKNRYYSLEHGPCQICGKRACSGHYFQGHCRPGQPEHGSYRARRSAFACNRQKRAERAPCLQAHQLANRR